MALVEVIPTLLKKMGTRSRLEAGALLSACAPFLWGEAGAPRLATYLPCPVTRSLRPRLCVPRAPEGSARQDCRTLLQ